MLAVLLAACSFSKGAKTEPLIGLTYSFNGLHVDDIGLFDTQDGNKLKSREISIGKTLHVQLYGVKGFTEEDGKVFIGCHLKVTDEEGNVALENEDLFPSESGYVSDQVGNLLLKVTMGSPIVAGKDYVTTAHIYDKKNPENVIDVTVKSEVR